MEVLHYCTGFTKQLKIHVRGLELKQTRFFPSKTLGGLQSRVGFCVTKQTQPARTTAIAQHRGVIVSGELSASPLSSILPLLCNLTIDCTESPT